MKNYHELRLGCLGGPLGDATCFGILIDLIGPAITHFIFFILGFALIFFFHYYFLHHFAFGLSINALHFIVKHINAVTRRPTPAAGYPFHTPHTPPCHAALRCQIIACVAAEAELRVNFNPIVCSQKCAAHKCKQAIHTRAHLHSFTCLYVYLFLRTAFPAECI